MSREDPREWITPLAVAGLAAAVALPSLWNGFVYDDTQVIVQNGLVHSLASAPDIWSSSYWPVGGLYRPLTIQLFSLEWALGGGHPMVFHIVSLLLAVLTTVLVWRLARRLLEPLPAAVAASLFAVHPVHVETVASTVGQSELLAALFTLLALERFLAWRVRGELGAGRRLTLAALTLLAIFSKETGYVAPLLMGAAELTVFRAPRRLAVPVFALQAGAVLAGLLIRLNVLGSLSGETPSAALKGLGVLERAGGMLGIVPQWARLLFWPVHLQAEYGPPALSVADAPAGARMLGAMLLIGALLLLLWGWRRRNGVALGVLWIAVAIFPVSNLLAPTGIVLAERTLFLPSVGAVLLVVALGGALARRVPPAMRLALGVALVVLIAVAGVRSALRALVWRSQSIFFTRLVEDAPRAYRAYYVVSRFHYGEGRNAESERAARRALDLYRQDHNVHDQLGQVLRTMGRCSEAVPILAEGVRVAPDETTIRSRLIECSLAVGDTAGARKAAADAVQAGRSEFTATLRRLSPASTTP